MGEPNTQFLASLEDPAKYRKVAGVPVFKPHERVLPAYKADDGTTYPEIRIKVSAADLPAIAADTRRAGPQPMTEGHRNLAPDFPEKFQPRKVGWEVNHRAGTAVIDPARGPEPVILADLCYERDLYDEVGPRRYPFRSADYDFREKRLAGLALLVRRPFLDLGMLPYSHLRGIAQYAFGEPIMPETAADADKYTPEEEAQYTRMCRYMVAYFKKNHPKMAPYMDGSEPGPTNTATYAATADLERRLAQSECERILDKVTTVRYDRARELATMVPMTADQRTAHVAYMQNHYEKLPAGGFIDTRTAATPGSGPARGTQPVDANGQPALTRAQMEAAIQYQSTAKVPYEAARMWALGNVPPGV